MPASDQHPDGHRNDPDRPTPERFPVQDRYDGHRDSPPWHQVDEAPPPPAPPPTR